MQDIVNILFSIFIACWITLGIRFIHAKQNSTELSTDKTFNNLIKVAAVIGLILVVGQAYTINETKNKILQKLESLKTN